MWKGAFDDLNGLFNTAMTNIKDWGYNLGTSLSEPLNTVAKVFAGFAANVFDTVTGAFKAMGDTVVSILKVFGIDVSTEWNGIKDTIQNTSNSIHEVANNGFNSTKNDGENAFTSLSSTISDTMNQANQNSNNATTDLERNASDNFSRTNNNGTNFISTLGDNIARIMGAARRNTDYEAGSIKRAFDFEWRMPTLRLPHFNWYTKTIGGFTFPIFGGIDWYAKGGIFDGATVAGIGEAGPEAVVPLSGARMNFEFYYFRHHEPSESKFK